jgi:uncharacterized lipoprotein YddW (UPF0748 family)
MNIRKKKRHNLSTGEELEMLKPLPRTVIMTVLLFCLNIIPNKAHGYYKNAGLWVVRNQLTSKKNIDNVINFARNNGITDLFVQVIGRGEAYYHTNIIPETQYVKVSQIDPLAYFCNKAEQYDLEIHAWVNILLVWSKPGPLFKKNHFINRHKSWFMVDKNNQNILQPPQKELKSRGIEGRFLSPAVPGLRKLYKLLVQELIENYNISGVHLDYIRYPSPDYGYHSYLRNNFKRQTGLDPIYLHKSSLLAEYSDVENLKEKWNRLRMDYLDSLVSDISRITGARDSIFLSAAVKPDPEIARTKYLQNWTGWLAKDIIDFVVVMNYAGEHEEFVKITGKLNQLEHQNRIWMGIGTYNQSPIITDKQVTVSIMHDYPGIVLFSYQSILDKNIFIKKYGLDQY